MKIVEAKSAPLYHGTGYKEAYEILKSDELRANISNETETYGVSLTRNKDAAYGDVSIVLDQERLNYDYKVKPVYRDGIMGLDLAEERVPKTIYNVSKYIIELQWNDKGARNSQLHILRGDMVRNFNDENFLDKPKIVRRSGGHEVTNYCYWLDKLITLANKKGIKLDKRFKEAEVYLKRFRSRVFDKEKANLLATKRSRKSNTRKTIYESKGISDKPWGDVDKSELLKAVIDKPSLAKKIYLKIEPNWQEKPSERLSYPIADKNGTVYRYGLASAMTYAKANNETEVINKLKKLYKEYGIEEETSMRPVIEAVINEKTYKNMFGGKFNTKKKIGETDFYDIWIANDSNAGIQVVLIANKNNPKLCIPLTYDDISELRVSLKKALNFISGESLEED